MSTAATSNLGEQIGFWICAALAVIGALGLVMSRKAVHSALSVALTMLSFAVLYALNGAPFLALVQVIVYTGAVMMLFLFVLMIVGVDASDSLAETIPSQRGWTFLFAVSFAAILITGIVSGLADTESVGLDQANAAAGGNVEGLAFLIFDRYLLAFQVVAAVLMTAALGALVLAHREHLVPPKSQRDLSKERFTSGRHPGVLPTPGVYSSSNAVVNPALLPDGSQAEESVPMPLRVRARVESAEGGSAQPQLDRGDE